METQVWDWVLEMDGDGGPGPEEPETETQAYGLGGNLWMETQAQVWGYQGGWREWRPGQRLEDLGTEAQAQDRRRSRTLYLSLL